MSKIRTAVCVLLLGGAAVCVIAFGASASPAPKGVGNERAREARERARPYIEEARARTRAYAQQRARAGATTPKAVADVAGRTVEIDVGSVVSQGREVDGRCQFEQPFFVAGTASDQPGAAPPPAVRLTVDEECRVVVKALETPPSGPQRPARPTEGTMHTEPRGAGGRP
jgi:hypothetical protein